MKRKLIAYGLIIVGAIPVIIKVALTFMARTDMNLEVNNEGFVKFYNEYGTGIIIGGFFAGIIMIVIGYMMLKKDRTVVMEMKDEADLDENERIVLKHKSQDSIVTVTNQRVRYYGFYTKDVKNKIKDAPDSDREDYRISDIQSVKSMLNSEMFKSSVIKLKGYWGIQMVMKSGKVVNIPAYGDAETLSNRIDITIKQS
jgi:hypothetical protein